MKMLEIAHYYMERMGYGDQPYVIFEHNDIERKHYHIVSTRIKPDGTTIDSFEYKKRSKALTEEIEREFNLIPTVQASSPQLSRNCARSNTRRATSKRSYLPYSTT
jgi:hypothetical protein